MTKPFVIQTTKEELTNNLYELFRDEDEIVIVCVGTDRSTGDALGPLVGEILGQAPLHNTTVYGNLEYPVHALTIADILCQIEHYHPNAFVLTVDAVLGKVENVGNVYVKKGALKPGAGVHKQLPEIGDAVVGAVVNVAGYMEMAVLQGTRLFNVMKLAELIAASIAEVIARKSACTKRLSLD